MGAIYIYVIMKTMYMASRAGPERSDFVATHALGHMRYGSSAQVHECQKPLW